MSDERDDATANSSRFANSMIGLLAFLTLLYVMMSVFYNFGFWTKVSPDDFFRFLTFENLLSNSMSPLWLYLIHDLPQLSVYMLIGGLIGLLLRWITPQSMVPRSAARALYFLPYIYLISVAAVIMWAVYLPDLGSDLNKLAAQSVGFSLLLAAVVFLLGGLRNFSASHAILAFFVLFLTLGSYAQGSFAGIRSYLERPATKIEFVSGEPKIGEVAGSVTHGVLFIERGADGPFDNRSVFYAADQIRRIDRIPAAERPAAHEIKIDRLRSLCVVLGTWVGQDLGERCSKWDPVTPITIGAIGLKLTELRPTEIEGGQSRSFPELVKALDAKAHGPTSPQPPNSQPEQPKE